MAYYDTVDQIDEVGNPIARFALIPLDDIDVNGWECCRERDESTGAGVAVPEDTALVPLDHWYEHRLRDSTNQQLADILVSEAVAAGARRPDGTFPRLTQLDITLHAQKQEAARTVLGEREFPDERISQIESGLHWPED